MRGGGHGYGEAAVVPEKAEKFEGKQGEKGEKIIIFQLHSAWSPWWPWVAAHPLHYFPAAAQSFCHVAPPPIPPLPPN